MFRKFGIVEKIVLLIIFLLFVTSVAIIGVNRWFYQRDLRAQIEQVQLPLLSNSIMPFVDSTSMDPARALTLLSNTPFLLEWLREGEPESGEGTIYQMLEVFAKQYNTLGANLISENTPKYIDFLEGRRIMRTVVIANDPWFHEFRDMNTPVGI